MENVKNYFTGLYEKALYGISMFGANLANKSLLTLINFKGLDPNSDPEKLKAQHLQNELNAAFDEFPYQKGQNVWNRVSTAIPWLPKGQSRFGYVNKGYHVPHMPDYSNSSGMPQATLNSLLQLAEKLDRSYQPASVKTPKPEVSPTAYVTNWSENAVNAAAESIRKFEDERILEVLESVDDACGAIGDIGDPFDHTIEKVLNKAIKKRVAASQKPAKKSKKPVKKAAKTSRKR